MMFNYYHEGIRARRLDKPRHENPYMGTENFLDALCAIFGKTRYVKHLEWDGGWEAEDKFQRSSNNANQS